ncbi:MAG: hypothetical protein JO057_01495 [Chloroflexi bacterium]|nr:hypothetical protein [Chloroflexota bacterium]
MLWHPPGSPPDCVDVSTTAGASPAHVGYYVFGPGPQAWTPPLESALRASLGEAPALTSFAWFKVTPSPLKTSVVGRIDAVAGPDGKDPVVKADVVFADLLEIGPGGPISLLTPDARVGFGFTYGPMAGLAPPAGAAISLWLANDIVGTFRFVGLLPFAPGLENITDVSIDPLAITDPSRTFVSFSGQSVLLRNTGDHYDLEPLT